MPSNRPTRLVISTRSALAIRVRRRFNSERLRWSVSRMAGSWEVRFNAGAEGGYRHGAHGVKPHCHRTQEVCSISLNRTTRERKAFFDSDIVQDEAKRLFSDYQQLMQLGSEYGKFDREGKKKFIETMEELMGRYRVFMKRFELSEDFQAKLTVEQLRTQLSQFGITPEQMFDQMNSTLERMKAQIEQPPSS